MNKGIKFLSVGIFTMLFAWNSYAEFPITVNWQAENQTYLALQNGVYMPMGGGETLSIGTFASTPVDGSPSLTGFTAFATGNLFADGAFSISSTTSDVGFRHDQIYLVVQTPGQLGIFYVNMANNSRWQFPAYFEVHNTTTIELEDLISNPGQPNPALAAGAHTVWGDVAYDASGPWTQVRLAAVPEPSSIALAILGVVSTLTICRQRRQHVLRLDRDCDPKVVSGLL